VMRRSLDAFLRRNFPDCFSLLILRTRFGTDHPPFAAWT
jgi:hypothetical protein